LGLPPLFEANLEGKKYVMEDYRLFIGGEFVKNSNQEYFPTINPYTNKMWANIPQASESQVADAISVARVTFETTWSKVSGIERARLLNKLADLLV
jgi:acyl-CoA reductase-like NAD-dependent aldehyde dehydrogenase